MQIARSKLEKLGKNWCLEGKCLNLIDTGDTVTDRHLNVPSVPICVYTCFADLVSVEKYSKYLPPPPSQSTILGVRTNQFLILPNAPNVCLLLVNCLAPSRGQTLALITYSALVLFRSLLSHPSGHCNWPLLMLLVNGSAWLGVDQFIIQFTDYT